VWIRRADIVERSIIGKRDIKYFILIKHGSKTAWRSESDGKGCHRNSGKFETGNQVFLAVKKLCIRLVLEKWIITVR
jgi:hypothetical protein